MKSGVGCSMYFGCFGDVDKEMWKNRRKWVESLRVSHAATYRNGSLMTSISQKHVHDRENSKYSLCLFIFFLCKKTSFSMSFLGETRIFLCQPPLQLISNLVRTPKKRPFNFIRHEYEHWQGIENSECPNGKGISPSSFFSSPLSFFSFPPE